MSMIYFKVKVRANGRKEVLSMPLAHINFREQYAIVRSADQFYLYKIAQQKLVPLSENSAAVYLTRAVIPPPQL